MYAAANWEATEMLVYALGWMKPWDVIQVSRQFIGFKGYQRIIPSTFSYATSFKLFGAHLRILHGCCFTHTIWEMMHCMLGKKCMNNRQTISLKSRARCYAMLPTACNAFQPIPGLINCSGVTGRWKLLSYAQNVVRWLALFLKVGRSCLKVLSLFWKHGRKSNLASIRLDSQNFQEPNFFCLCLEPW